MGLNQEQIGWLSYYVDAGDRIGYYGLLASFNEPYGTQALGIVSADTLMGAAANIYMVESSGTAVFPYETRGEKVAQIGLDLMRADFLARSDGGDIGWQEIQEYHNDVFVDHGLAVDAWVPNFVLNALDTPEKKAAFWDDLVEAGPVTGAITLIEATLTAESISGPEATQYLQSIIDAGASASLFPSHDYGLYDIELANGVHVIGDNQSSGPVSGYSGTDVIMGFGGDDIIKGRGGDDLLYGGLGNDHLIGGSGSDELSDDFGIDILEGGEGEIDYYLLADDGEPDTIIVGEGYDWIESGGPEDRIVFRTDMIETPPGSWTNPATGIVGTTTAIPILGGVLRKRDVRGQAAACWAQMHGITMLTMEGLFQLEKVGPDPLDAALVTLLEGLENQAVNS